MGTNIGATLGKIRDFLGLRPAIAAVLAMAVLVGTGEKMAERFVPLYLLALGGGTLAVGLLNGLDNLLSALYSYPGGAVSDRLGYKRALLVFNLIAMTGYIIAILAPTWHIVILGAILFISWTAISLPATMELVASVLPKHKHTMGVSLHSLVRRIPMALGPLIGGTLIGAYGPVRGIRLAFFAALVLAGVAVILQQRFIDEKREPPAPGNAEKPAQDNHTRLLTPPLRRLLVSDILVRFCEQIPYAFVVLWCVNYRGVTPFQFGILSAIEMATAMLIYIPVAWLADQGEKKPFVVTTFVFFTLFPLMLLWARSFPAMVLAFVVRGLKEFGEPTRKALIMALAPPGRKAATFGLYYLIRDLVVSVAAFGGALLWDSSIVSQFVSLTGIGEGFAHVWAKIASPQLNFLVASACGAAGTAYFALFGKGENVSSATQTTSNT